MMYKYLFKYYNISLDFLKNYNYFCYNNYTTILY